MIPKVNYPETLDNDQNLFQVSDGLRLSLSEDYNPGDKSISVFGNEDIIRSFDETGIITLTEQCSEPELRALSFYYKSRTLNSFDELELLPGFIDCPKPKRITNVTQNVVSLHHNNLKDALIRIERFAGKKGEVGKYPLKGTMEERINYLRKLVLAPKAWLRVDKKIGLAPLTVEFTDQSFYLGTDGAARSVKRVWDFGDNTNITEISIISIKDSVVPSNVSNVLAEVECPNSSFCKVQKTYNTPGIYDVSLTITNDFGLYELSDTVVFPKMINVRFPAPDEATIDIVGRGGQNATPGFPVDPENGRPYEDSKPKIRSPINSLIDIKIKDEKTRLIPGSYTDSNNLNRTYSGEVVNESNTPIDPISSYTWFIADDLVHGNSKNTKALFGVGGYFDLMLRTDTAYNAYRITVYKDAFDIIENYNLWLWYTDEIEAYSYEFGMISETFKIKGSSLILNVNTDFIDNSSKEKQIKNEFLKNNGAAKRSSVPSGNGGTATLYWSSGRNLTDPISTERIIFSEYNGFDDVYISRDELNRPWNWLDFNYNQNLYFIFGGISDGNSATSQQKTKYDTTSYTSSSSLMNSSNYKNGAIELSSNTMQFSYRNSIESSFSVYRSAWHDSSGYFLRNEGGLFYRLNSFYKTSGNSSEPFLDIRKLSDMPGSKVEGSLVSLSQGLYFFNNSGSVSAYSVSSGSWTTGGPGTTSSLFRSLQDTTKIGFDDPGNTLIAASNGDKIAFLSYDYSTKCFIKFNESDTTFKSISNSPERGSNIVQWQMYIF